MASNVIDKLSDSNSLLNVMIKMEDFLDSLDLYVYKNWIDGEIVSGPHVTRYWTSFTLMYDYKKMPDPTGALRLMKHGALVKYKQAEKEDNELHLNATGQMFDNIVSNQYNTSQQQGMSDQKQMQMYAPLPKKKIWLVEVFIPRKFIDDAFDMDIGTMAADAEVADKKPSKGGGDNAPPADANSPMPATDTTSAIGDNALSSPEAES